MKSAPSRNKTVINIASNFLNIGVNLVIGIFMAPYLIKKLGIGVYGIVALVNTFPAYIQIFTTGLSNSTTKFMAISLEKGNFADANNYFFTSLRSLNWVILLFLPLVILLSIYAPQLFNVPANTEHDTQLLVLFVLLATFINIIQAPFGAIFQVYHRFLEKNAIMVVSKILAVLVLIILFQALLPSVWFVGIYQIVLTLLTAILLFLNYRKYQKTLDIKLGSFKFQALKEMSKLGFWNTLNDIAALFFLMVSQVLINQYLGSEASGLFGPVLILLSLILLGGGAISGVTMPIIYRDIAIDRKQKEIDKRLLLISKLLAYIIGFPIIIIIGFTDVIIELWLGSEFLEIATVIKICVVSLFLGGILFLPYSHYYRGLDKMKTPAIFNFSFGLLNIILIMLLFHYGFGLSGVAYSFCLTFGIRGILFNLFYISKINKSSILTTIKEIGPLILKMLLLITLAIVIARSSISFFMGISLLIIVFSGFLLSYGFNKYEKDFLKRIIKNESS